MAQDRDSNDDDPTAPDILPRGDVLKDALAQLYVRTGRRVNEVQGKVPTFADMHLLRLMAAVEALPADAPWEDSAAAMPGPGGEWLRRALHRVQCRVMAEAQGRYVAPADRPRALAGDPDHRVYDTTRASVLPDQVLAASQGMDACLSWRGRPLFKTVYDFALLPMIVAELKPATVFEIGSGSGAGAVWLADVAAMQGVKAAVVSLDIKPPALEDPRVDFVAGDCNRIAEALPDARLAAAPHPWLVVEDAHVNVAGVLAHFHRHTVAGDCLFVEDSLAKRADLAAIHADQPGAYRIDTRYTDFFGRNATSAIDSILVRM